MTATPVGTFPKIHLIWQRDPFLINPFLVALIGVTLVCEDANSRRVDVVTVDAEKHVDHSLVHTWELKLGNKAKLLFRL